MFYFIVPATARSRFGIRKIWRSRGWAAAVVAVAIFVSVFFRFLSPLMALIISSALFPETAGHKAVSAKVLRTMLVVQKKNNN